MGSIHFFVHPGWVKMNFEKCALFDTFLTHFWSQNGAFLVHYETFSIGIGIGIKAFWGGQNSPPLTKNGLKPHFLAFETSYDQFRPWWSPFGHFGTQKFRLKSAACRCLVGTSTLVQASMQTVLRGGNLKK